MFVMERTEYICVRHKDHKKMTMKNAKEQEKYEAEMLAGSSNVCVQT